MKKHVKLVFVVMCLMSVFPTFGSWVETFDSGVGRFTQTYGLGNEKFTWNESGQNLHFEFRRRLTGDAYADMRYSDFGRLIDLKVDNFSFSLSFILEGWSNTLYGNVGHIGFLCGSPETPEFSLTADLRYKKGMGVFFGPLPTTLYTGIHYRFECNYRAETRTFSIDLYNVESGEKIGTLTKLIDVANQPSIYGFGFCADNDADPSTYYWIRGYIDDVSIASVSTSVLSPNGGESYLGGATQDITWSAEGVGGQLLLQYSEDNGSSWADIETVSNTGTYPWIIPNIISNTCLIKISSIDDPSVFDISNSPFSIHKPSMCWRVEEGGNGHFYQFVATPNKITWLEARDLAESYGGHLVSVTSMEEHNFLLQNVLSPSTGISILIGLLKDGQGNWGWVTGEPFSFPYWRLSEPNGRVGEDYGCYTMVDQSYAGFSDLFNDDGSNPKAFVVEYEPVGNVLTISFPNGGDILPAMTTTEIKWNSSGSINQVLLEYSTNNGTDWTSINTVSNTGSYQWQVPDIASIQCLIRIADVDDPSTFDVSNSTFSIRGLEWYSHNGHQYALTLRHSNWFDAEAEAISIGGHLVTINDQTENDWLVDDSSNPFGLQYGRDAYGNWCYNTIWIGLAFIGGDKTLTSSWAWQDGEPIGFWNISPEAFAPIFIDGTHMYINGSDPSRTYKGQWAFDDVFDINPGLYLRGIIEFSPTINILTPKPSDFVSTINAFTITWEMETKIPVPQVKIELSTDNGTSWQLIDQVDNTGIYSWSIPDLVSDQCILRISDPLDPAFKSTVPFEIGRSPRVYFADANLKSAVEQALAVTNPTYEDMLKLTYLNAKSKGITSLVGLETALNLTTLYLHQNTISDITPLAGLTKLTTLNLYANNITDISSLAGMTKLISLAFSSNKVSDISYIAGMNNLIYLYISYNQINDFSALTGNTKFKEIYATRNAVLTKETYLNHIPTIRANNPNLTVFQYDPGCSTFMSGDVNQDCHVNLSDLAMISSNWLKCNHFYEEMCP